MIDVQKLKYDLAMQSALAATILNRREDETVAAQMAHEFTSAYSQYCSDASLLDQTATDIKKSEQLAFKLANSLVEL